MTFEFHCTGADRKKLVTTTAAITETAAKYLGAPTFAYQVGPYHIDKNGTMTVAEGTAPSDVDYLIERLYEEGFTAETSVEETHICISMPSSLFTDTALENLDAIIAAKGELIKKALGVTALPILREDGKVCFPWFSGDASPEEIKAYDNFICKLCEMAHTQKRITAKEKEVDNEKYAFRCFLLRLGFIGAEFKSDRKILLRNLSGSSAFKGGQQKEVQA